MLSALKKPYAIMRPCLKLRLRRSGFDDDRSVHFVFLSALVTSRAGHLFIFRGIIPRLFRKC